MREMTPEEVALKLIRLRNDTRTRAHEMAVMKKKMDAARKIEKRNEKI